MAQTKDNKYLRIQTLDSDPTLSAALGNMVIAWSYAEQALMNVMGRVTELPPEHGAQRLLSNSHDKQPNAVSSWASRSLEKTWLRLRCDRERNKRTEKASSDSEPLDT